MIQQVRSVIEREMQAFEKAFAAALQTDAPLLKASVEHFLQRKGKGFRPSLVFLASNLCSGGFNVKTTRASVALELLHSASLIHDDVVDETHERRGMMTLNARFNNKVSVLTGDYFLSASLQTAIETGNMEILNELCTCTKELTKGELTQLATARDMIISEANYYDVIYKKTASLFVACVRSGALSVDASPQQMEALSQFAKRLGLCFQIRDDVFDYFADAAVGKPTGNDIREGKITLPLLYALRENSDAETDEVSMLIQRKEFTPDNINRIIEYAKRRGGIEYANAQMARLRQEAIAQLEGFEKNRYYDTLVQLLNHSIERSN